MLSTVKGIIICQEIVLHSSTPWSYKRYLEAINDYHNLSEAGYLNSSKNTKLQQNPTLVVHSFKPKARQSWTGSWDCLSLCNCFHHTCYPLPTLLSTKTNTHKPCFLPTVQITHLIYNTHIYEDKMFTPLSKAFLLKNQITILKQ